MLDPQVMSNNTVDTCAAVIQVIIRQDDQDSIPSLLSLHEYRVATEEL